MSHKPTLIFVPGAWHNASTWNKVASSLEVHQYRCLCATLPSTADNPDATFLDDVEAVRSLIIAETSKGNNVVVVVHSYGGQVGNSAIKGLTRPTKYVQSQTGQVVGIIMLASGFTVTGMSFIDGLGGKPPPSWKADEESGLAVLATETRQLFYHDLPQDEGDYWVSKLEQQSLRSLFEGGEHAYSGWKDVPVWYLATTDDQALPIQAQRLFVQMAKDAGADVTLREVNSSHSPMLSKPKETIDFILEAAASFAG